MSSFAAFGYDAAMLYARTIDAMIKAGVDYRNGAQFLYFAQTIFFEGLLQLF